ncbi:mucin-5AC-like [Sycon ciliatum]|uniref:mucin-5AC-like n=1 Tax=Sycon ciliatum TaxID=27933 RepID=UPI0031F61464
MEERKSGESRHSKKRKSSRERSPRRKRKSSRSRSPQQDERKKRHRHRSHSSKSSHRHRERSEERKDRHGRHHQQNGKRSSDGHKDHHRHHGSAAAHKDKENKAATKAADNNAAAAAAAVLPLATVTKTVAEPTPSLSTTSSSANVAEEVPSSAATGLTARPVASGQPAFDDESRPRTLIHYLHDRKRMVQEAFSALSAIAVDRMLPKPLQGVSLVKVKELCCDQIKTLSDEQIRAVIEEGRLFAEEELGIEPLNTAPPVQDTEVDSPMVDSVITEDPISHAAMPSSPQKTTAAPAAAAASAAPAQSLDEGGECPLVEIMVGENMFDDDSLAKTVAVTPDSTSQMCTPDGMSLAELQRRRRELETELANARATLESPAKIPKLSTSTSSSSRRSSKASTRKKSVDSAPVPVPTAAAAAAAAAVVTPDDIVVITSSPERSPEYRYRKRPASVVTKPARLVTINPGRIKRKLPEAAAVKSVVASASADATPKPVTETISPAAVTEITKSPTEPASHSATADEITKPVSKTVSPPAVTKVTKSPPKAGPPTANSSDITKAPVETLSPAVAHVTKVPVKTSSPTAAPVTQAPMKASSPAVAPTIKASVKTSSPAVAPTIKASVKTSSPAVAPVTKAPVKALSPAVAPVTKASVETSSPAVAPKTIAESSAKPESPEAGSKAVAKPPHSPNPLNATCAIAPSKQDGDVDIDMEKEEQRLRLRALKSMNKRLLMQRGKQLT